MTISTIAMIVITALIFVTALIAAWHLRFQIIGVAILVGCAYLLYISDMFLVIRVPTICVVGMGVLLAVFTFVPRPVPRKGDAQNS